jgi:hypothetical protein
MAVCTANSAFAQDITLSRFLADFVTRAALLNARPDLNQDRSRDFVLGTTTNRVPRAINQALAMQLTTFPPTVNWPGLADAPGTSPGTTEHRRALFGSSYVERAATIGARHLGVAFSEQTAQFKTLDGLSLRDGLTLYFESSDSSDPNRLGDLQPPFERDVLQENISMRLDRTVFSFAANYGLTDRLDVGLLIPVIKVSFDGRITAHVNRTATIANPEIHSFDLLELDHKTTYATRDVHGIGDLGLRVKYRLVGDAGGGLGAVFGLRLPTGNVEDFLGAGTTTARMSVIWSAESQKIGPHINVSYARPIGTVTGDFGVPTIAVTSPSEVLVVGGTDIMLHPRWAVSGDVMWRRLENITRFHVEDTVFRSRGPGTLPSADFIALDNVVTTGSGQSADQSYAVGSSKLLIGERLIVHGDVLVPLRRTGLSAGIGALIGAGVGF